jgi:hypothetical protein
MRKYYLLKFTALALSLSGLVMSCKNDDDDEPVKPVISFETNTMTVNEADGVIEVKVKLDKAAEEDITIEYELAGSAIDVATVDDPDTDESDYGIVEDNNDHGEIEIEAGETEGVIEIELYSDVLIEDSNEDTDPLDPETIEIELTDVDTEDVEISTDNTMDISIEQEDGVLVLLAWAAPTETDSADMDMVVRYGANTTTWQGFMAGSLRESFTAPEFVFIPNGPDIPAFGMSYTYFAGNREPLSFEVIFADMVDGVLEEEANVLRYEGEYSLANVNKWTEQTNGLNSTKVVQTFGNTGGTFTGHTEITVPASGSRVPSINDLPHSFRKQSVKHVTIPRQLQSFINRINKK